MIRFLIPAMFLAILTGCAVMDTSVLDSAEPLKSGHFKAEAFVGTGLILESAVYNVGDNSYDSDDNSGKDAIFMGLEGFKIGAGINDKAEIGGKIWASLSSQGAKVYLKYLINQSDDIYYSIMPSFTYAGNEYKNNDNNGNYDQHTYKSVGFELPFLITNKISEHFSFTAAARFNYNNFRYEIVNEYENDLQEIVKRGPYSIYHYGILGNVRIKVLYLVLTPELGMEIVPVIHGNLTVSPTYGLALGLQF